MRIAVLRRRLILLGSLGHDACKVVPLDHWHSEVITKLARSFPNVKNCSCGRQLVKTPVTSRVLCITLVTRYRLERFRVPHSS